MRCPKCGNENPEGAKFCMKCGARFSQICPQCGAGNLAEAVYCEQCGTGLVPTETGGTGRRWVLYLLVFIGGMALVGILGAGIWLLGKEMGWWNGSEPTPTAAPAAPEPTMSPDPTATQAPPPSEPAPTETYIGVTLPPPLAVVEFPMQAEEYPSDWPSELRYPESFTLVETSSGTLVDGAAGWGAKLRYQGEPQVAADELSSFFTSQGWLVIERTELDSGGVLLLVQREDGSGSGVLVLDPDPDLEESGHTIILATILP